MILRKQLILTVIAVSSAGLLAGLVHSQGLDNKIDAQKKQLDQIQADINKHREKSKALDREETNVMKQLSNLGKDIDLSQKLIRSLEEREKLLSQRIDTLRVDVAYEDGMLRYQQARLNRRLRQMYMSGPHYDWQVLLSSTDMQDAVRRYKFVRLVAQRDARLVSEVSQRKLSMETEQAALTEAMAEIATAKNERESEAGRLAASKEDQMAMLSRIRSDKTKHDEAIAELKRSQEKLQNLIEELEQRRQSETDTFVPDGDFAKLKGKLMRPVEGTITKKFGPDRHPKFGTVTFNNGVKIKAPAGTPIRAVAAAKVEFVDWISGYGNCIILNHGGGYYTLYAHAAEIFVHPGQTVKARDVIAEVGNTGSLNGYECHFEIRKSKEALDPMQWFKR